MSHKGDELNRRAERGARIRAIREALEMNGDDFARAVNAAAGKYRYSPGYNKSIISRLESGTAAYFLAEEAIAIASLDPKSRGVTWLVFGREEAEAEVPELPAATFQPVGKGAGKKPRRAVK